MKPLDAESYEKRIYIQKGGNRKNDNFEMEILEEDAIEKALNVEKKTTDEKHGKKYMR